MNTPTMLDRKDQPLLSPPEEEEKLLPPPPTGKLSVRPARRRSYWWLWLLIFAGIGYGGWRFYQRSKANQDAAKKAQAARANRSTSVVTAPVRRGDIPVYLRGLGSVTAFNTVTVKSRVDGQLVQVAFKEGQFVNKGDLLVQIDPRPYQVAVDQAVGQLARDQAQLKDAQVNLDRYQTLWEEQVIPKQQLDTQAATVGQSKGTIEADQAAIDNAKLQLVYSRITAPISGRIGLRLVDIGNMVHASDTNGLVVITQLQPISVIFTIPADNLPPVLKKLNAGIHLEVDAYDRDDKNKLATGSLLTVDNQIDQSTGTSRLKANFDNKDNALFPNQFVNCRMLLDTHRGVALIPVPAIQRGPQGTFVYVATPEGTATVRQVNAGLTEGNDAEIDGGLQVGEQVVTDGQDKLQEGSKIEGHTSQQPTGRRGRGNPGHSQTPGVTPVGTPPSPDQAPARPAKGKRSGQPQSGKQRTGE